MKIAVLTDSETASGFRLAGLETFTAENQDEAVALLEELVQRDDLALLAVDEGLVPDPLSAVARALRGRDLPVVLPFPSLSFAFGEEGEDAKAYLRRLVKSTIGYEVKL